MNGYERVSGSTGGAGGGSRGGSNSEVAGERWHSIDCIVVGIYNRVVG